MMQIFYTRIILLSYFIFSGAVAHAQVKFSASISPTVVSKSEYVTLRIVVENGRDISKITPPTLDGFMVVSGPSQETGMSSINGAVTQYIAFSYILQPLKPGKFRLGVATAYISNKLYKSEPLVVEVNRSVIASRQQQGFTQSLLPLDADDRANAADLDFRDFVLHKGENVAEKVSKNMFLQLETSKKNCYVGEALVANYKFYSRLKSESKLTKNPSFNGFSVIDLSAPDDMQSPQTARVHGKDYNVYSIRKAQLYPLQAGEITLDAATMDNEIQFLKEGENSMAAEDLLSGFGMDPNAFVTQAASISSKPVTIHVKELPVEGKPVSFKGAVGQFKINSALQKDNFTTDETGNLIITLSGSGNLQLITAPELNWPQGITGFEPQLTETIDNAKVPISGEKVFIYPFSFQNEGNFLTPSATLSFFDPTTGLYQTVTTNSLKVMVTRSALPTALKPTAAVTETSFNTLNGLNKNRWWAIAALAVLIMTGLYLSINNSKKRTLLNEQKINEPKQDIAFVAAADATISNQINPLGASEICLLKENCFQFFEELNRELRQFLSTRFLVPVGSLNSSSVATILDGKGVDNETILQTEKLLKALELQLYSPLKQIEVNREFYNRAFAIVQTINDQRQSVNL